MTTSPRLFVSYSHDNSAHKGWVLNLANRLVLDGVDVLLDQWGLPLGGDLSNFMENGLTGADRVLAICSDTYVQKANDSQGGVGYEKMILTGQLMQNVTSNKIIPIVRQNNERVLPTFLSTRLYSDFQDDSDFESSYATLLREIHESPMVARPQIGPNPFAVEPLQIEPRLSFSNGRYVSPGQSGIVSFDYSNNDGRYVVGSGDMQFETKWTEAGNSSIYAYSDSPSIRSLALALDVENNAEITNATIYDSSSRVRTPKVGEIVVWQNTLGYFLATKIEKVAVRSRGAPADELTFSYLIATDRGSNFSSGT